MYAFLWAAAVSAVASQREGPGFASRVWRMLSPCLRVPRSLATPNRTKQYKMDGGISVQLKLFKQQICWPVATVKDSNGGLTMLQTHHKP